MKSIGAVIVGLVLVAGSLYFVYPYADFTPKVQHAHVTAAGRYIWNRCHRCYKIIHFCSTVLWWCRITYEGLCLMFDERKI